MLERMRGSMPLKMYSTFEIYKSHSKIKRAVKRYDGRIQFATATHFNRTTIAVVE